MKVKVRTCNCVETGLKGDSIFLYLLKLKHPTQLLVGKCQHWETYNLQYDIDGKELQ